MKSWKSLYYANNSDSGRRSRFLAVVGDPRSNDHSPFRHGTRWI